MASDAKLIWSNVDIPHFKKVLIPNKFKYYGTQWIQ